MSKPFGCDSVWIIAPLRFPVKTFFALTLVSRNPPIKAQQRGFDLEATNDDTGEKTHSRVFEHCVINEELVTRTGFEPMLKA